MSLKFEAQPDCPVCLTERDETGRRYATAPMGIPIEYAHCTHCGVLWQTSRLADDYLGEYYANVYRQITAPTPHARAQTDKVGHMRAAIQVSWLSDQLDSRKTALDYGCSGGWLLEALQNRGMTVTGVEMDKTELSQPARGKFTIYDTIDEAPGQYDLIAMSHVLEHFNHPLEGLKPITAKIKPGGLLFVDVPNYRSLPGYGTGLHHPICFDAASLAWTLRAAGLEPLEHAFYDWDNTPMDKYLMMIAMKPKAQRKAKK
jgi:SAM-dependent methyltransferase